MRSEWPLAGRRDELAGLLRHVRDDRGALVSGPAGVGKTRLAHEAVARVAGRSTPAQWAVASTSARSVPFGAFTAITSALAPAAADTALLARVATALRATDTVLGVDDAHSLDPASADLVYALAADHAVRMVVTIRDGETAPDAIRALDAEGLLPRLALRPLDRAQTEAVLTAALAGPVDGITVDRLHETTGGNALWLRMLVEGELADGRITRVRGTWVWTGDLRLSPALDGLVAAGVDRLDGPAREALELLALGEPLAPAVLGELVDSTAVDAVVARGLARPEADGDAGRLRLAHPLFGEAVRARISTLRARRLRGALYEALSRSSDGRDDVLRRAVLLLDSDRPHRPELLMAAAISALALSDAGAAVRLAGGARDAGGGFEAQMMYAFLLAWSWTGDPSVQSEFHAAVELARSDDERIRAGLGAAFGMLFEWRYSEYLERRAELVALLDDPVRAVEVDGVAATFAVLRNELPRASELVDAIRRSPGAGAAALAFAGWAAAAIAAVQGWSDASALAVRSAYEACRQQPETTSLQINIAFWEVLGLSLAGRLDEAAVAVAPLAEVPPGTRFMGDAIASLVDIAAGRVGTAAGKLRDALLRAPGEFGGWTKAWAALACIAASMAGDVAAAEEAWRTVVRYSKDRTTIDDPWDELAQAWLAAAEGAVSEALDRARTAAATAAATHQWAFERMARLCAVRLGDPTQADRLAASAVPGSGPLPAAAAAHARAVADQSADGLDAAAAAYEEAGLLLLAADATAQAAVLHRAAGASAAAEAATSRAADLARRCEDARTPALVAALHPLPISTREREIATLAHAGFTNRQIGERLHLSTRTVEGHVYHACTKLGVPGRRALAEYVAGVG